MKERTSSESDSTDFGGSRNGSKEPDNALSVQLKVLEGFCMLFK